MVTKPASRSRWKHTNSSPWSSRPALVEAAAVRVAAAEDPVRLRLGGARVGQPDVGVERNPVAGRVASHSPGHRVLARPPEWRPGALGPTDDRLLLAQGGAVPALHEHPDRAHDHVAATDRPGGFAVGLADPDEVVHQPGVGRRRVGGAVLEAQQVAWRRRACRRRRSSRPVAAGSRGSASARRARLRDAGHEVAQGVDAARLVRGADLDHQVAVAERRLQPVVREDRHPHQLLRAPVARPNRSSNSDAPKPTVTVRSDGPTQARGCRSPAADRAGSPASGAQPLVTRRAHQDVSSASVLASPGRLPATTSRATKIAAVWVSPASRSRPGGRRRTGCSRGPRGPATGLRPPSAIATPPRPPATAAAPTAADPVRKARRERFGGGGSIARPRPRVPAGRSARRAVRTDRPGAPAGASGRQR